MNIGDHVTGTSFNSFSEAALQAFENIQGDPDAEGLASAKVIGLSVEKGGFVGKVQFIVELEATRAITEPAR